nr:LuxR C-terminal-related transcriptional regulator [Saccharopolyspora sp. HNM0983]
MGESRVVTLTGPGGVGKTRLATRVAANMRRSFRDKAKCIELEDVEDGAVVVDAVIEQLGLGGSSTGDLNTVVDHLKDREMLLVLDNCEHVVQDVALLVDAVLRWCPGVRVLATSRQSLGVAGESTVVVPSLNVPDIEHLPDPESYEQYASVRLFVERARSAVPEFEVTPDNAVALMRLVHHLDGNPLAIELAAVRLRSLSPQQLEQRLAERYDLLTEGRRGAPARQRTLRALIDWSYGLASETDRLTWARVSVFSGTFDLAAAEHVAGAGMSESEVLGAMHSLVDQSVLLREEESGEVRYRLPHTLREYGHDKLEASGEADAVRGRHCAWFADVTARFAQQWVGPDQVAWVNRLSSDLGNLRVALRTAISDRSTAAQAMRMTIDLGQYWGIRGLNGEARHWLDAALTIAPSDAVERVGALRVNAWFALLQGDLAKARPLLEQATVLATQRADEIERTKLAVVRGLVSMFVGEPQQGVSVLEEALAKARKFELRTAEMFALFALGLLRNQLGDPQAGRDLLGECIRITGELGEQFWRSYALWAAAQIDLESGDLDRAERQAKKALRTQVQLSNRLAIAFDLDVLAWIAEAQGRHERAARLFGCASAAWEMVRAAPTGFAGYAERHAAHERRVRQAIGEEAFEDAFERGRELTQHQAADLALEVKKQQRQRTDENVHPMPLTRRERQIAELVAQGGTNKEIAENLVIAQRTVEGHVQNILTKLDYSSRAQIAGWVAAQKGAGETSPA